MSLSSPRPGLPGLQELRHAGHLQDALPGGVQGGRRGQGDVRARGAGEAGGGQLCTGQGHRPVCGCRTVTKPQDVRYLCYGLQKVGCQIYRLYI